MVFSTPLFLFVYLSLTLLLYYAVPLKGRNLALLAVSLFFYAWGERIYVVIMVASTLIDYTHGMLVERCKARGNDRGARWAVASSVFFNLALLGFFKYWDFLAASFQAVGLNFMPVLNIHLPIGISFYTFQTMSYTIDVYRGDARAQRSLVNFGTFVTLFPQLIAGPIIKYKDLGDQIDSRTCTVEKFASGVQMFVIGLGKKVLIANNVGMLWESYKAMAPGDLTVAGSWLGVLAFAIQIYFDFSGYSDMAVGLGRMLGFEFMRNFNYPYISRSITEFWRRWHISLSTWVREYLDIPLGGQPLLQGAVGPESVPGVGGHRHLARGQLELRALGIVLLGTAAGGEICPAPVAEAGPRCGRPPLHPVFCAGELDHLRHRGLRTAGGVPEGDVRSGRRAPDRWGFQVLRGQLSAGPLHLCPGGHPAGGGGLPQAECPHGPYPGGGTDPGRAVVVHCLSGGRDL